MVVRGKLYHLVTLRGDSAEPGIEFVNGICSIAASRWGMKRGNTKNLLISPLHTKKRNARVRKAALKRTTNGALVLTNGKGTAGDEIVLVQEYLTGVGAKRWPGFRVEFESFPDVQILAEDRTLGGSGWEHWVVVKAPTGWAKRVAVAFNNRRDVGDQTITAADL